MNHTHYHHPGPPLAKSAAEAKARNSFLLCKARGCTEHRQGLDAYCPQHQSVYRKYGHPRASPIKPAQYTRYRKEVTAIFEANLSHPGLVSALDYVTRWMLGAAACEDSSKAAPEIARLVRHGTSSREVLVEVCSFWCFLHDSPRALPDTRSENFALSRAVMHLAPRPRRYTREAVQKGTTGYQLRPRFSALDSIGAWLRSVLAQFFVTVYEAVSTKEARAAETLAQLRAPLASPTAVYLQEAAAKPQAAPPVQPSALPFHSDPRLF